MEMTEATVNAFLERPHSILVGKRRYYLYPLTLGKSLLLQRLIASLNINESVIREMPTFEVLRIVKNNRYTCLRLVYYCICRGKDEVFDADYSQATVNYLSENLNDDELSTLLLTALSMTGADEIMDELGITEENNMLRSVLDAKQGGSGLTFGGKSIYGTFVDPLCERYGWTMDYVVWGISYANGRLLLADKVNTIYLNEDERKRVPRSVLSKDEDTIRATKENMDIIKQMDWR